MSRLRCGKRRLCAFLHAVRKPSRRNRFRTDGGGFRPVRATRRSGAPCAFPLPFRFIYRSPRRRPNVSATATLPLSETEAAPRKAEAPSKNAKESLDEASFAVENITRITPQLFLKFYKWMKILGIVFCILGALALVLYIVSFFTYDEYGNPAPDDSALLAACVLIACGVMLIIVRAVYTKNAKITENTRQIVRFGERAIHIFDFEGDRPFSQAHILYERITRVRPDEGVFDTLSRERRLYHGPRRLYGRKRSGAEKSSDVQMPARTVGMKN